MKKILFIVTMSLLSLAISNCASPEKRMNYKLSQTYIGMHISEFHKIFRKKELVRMEGGKTIYLVRENAYYAGVSTYRYFYFSNDRLERIDKGVRAVDERKQIDININ